MPAGKNITKILVLGATSVGKTSIIEQIVYANYYLEKEMYPTIEDTYDAWIDIDRVEKERIRIYDVKGQDADNLELPLSHVQVVNAFMLVFSVTSKKSFELVKTLKKEVESARGKDIPMVLIGTKVDSDSRDCEHAASVKWAKDEKVKLFEVTTISRPTLQEPLSYLVKKVVPAVAKSNADMKRIFSRGAKKFTKDSTSSDS